MRIVDWTDERGRKYKSRIPDGARDEDAAMGILVGPPNVADALGWPEPLATRLHNNLFDRGLFTAEIVRKSPQALQAVIRATFKIDVHILMDAYIKAGMELYIDDNEREN